MPKDGDITSVRLSYTVDDDQTRHKRHVRKPGYSLAVGSLTSPPPCLNISSANRRIRPSPGRMAQVRRLHATGTGRRDRRQPTPRSPITKASPNTAGQSVDRPGPRLECLAPMRCSAWRCRKTSQPAVSTRLERRLKLIERMSPKPKQQLLGYRYLHCRRTAPHRNEAMSLKKIITIGYEGADFEHFLGTRQTLGVTHLARHPRTADVPPQGFAKTACGKAWPASISSTVMSCELGITEDIRHHLCDDSATTRVLQGLRQGPQATRRSAGTAHAGTVRQPSPCCATT